MISGIDRVTARRIWFVPDLVVWGLPSLGEYEFLLLDEEDSTKSVYYGIAAIGENEQEVLFSQLSDHRGNTLPTSIKSPRVFPRARSSEAVFVVGKESSDRFKIARDQEAGGPVTVDLLVVELGD